MPVVQCYARARVALRVGERSLTSTTTTTTTTTTTRRVGRKQPRARGVRVRTQASLLGVGTPEVLVIGVVALLVFGPKVGNIFFFFQSFFFPQFLLMFTLFVFSSKKKKRKIKIKISIFLPLLRDSPMLQRVWERRCGRFSRQFRSSRKFQRNSKQL